MRRFCWPGERGDSRLLRRAGEVPRERQNLVETHLADVTMRISSGAAPAKATKDSSGEKLQAPPLCPSFTACEEGASEVGLNRRRRVLSSSCQTTPRTVPRGAGEEVGPASWSPPAEQAATTPARASATTARPNLIPGPLRLRGPFRSTQLDTATRSLCDPGGTSREGRAVSAGMSRFRRSWRRCRLHSPPVVVRAVVGLPPRDLRRRGLRLPLSLLSCRTLACILA